jgi:hypothetical protein
MQEFTIEYWYRYGGANEKDFEEEKVTAASYDQAVEKLKEKHKHIFKTTDKTNYEIKN